MILMTRSSLNANGRSGATNAAHAAQEGRACHRIEMPPIAVDVALASGSHPTVASTATRHTRTAERFSSAPAQEVSLEALSQTPVRRPTKHGAPVVCVEALDAQARPAPRISWKLRAAAALSATRG
jgi:hypothetical protein